MYLGLVYHKGAKTGQAYEPVRFPEWKFKFLIDVRYRRAASSWFIILISLPPSLSSEIVRQILKRAGANRAASTSPIIDWKHNVMLCNNVRWWDAYFGPDWLIAAVWLSTWHRLRTWTNVPPWGTPGATAASGEFSPVGWIRFKSSVMVCGQTGNGPPDWTTSIKCPRAHQNCADTLLELLLVCISFQFLRRLWFISL